MRYKPQQTPDPSESLCAGGPPDQPNFARDFQPSQLDLGDLAEAIRYLLTIESGQQDVASDGPQSNLLSPAPRGTHVVEANGTA